MKIKELFYLFGFKSKPQQYGYKVYDFDLPGYGKIEYAQWLHPREKKKIIDEELISPLKDFLTESDTCIDIGAHTGDTTIPMALAVGKSGCVIAMEPNKYVYPVLEKNSQLNTEKTNIIPIMAAATEEDGELEFEYSDSGFCNGGLHQGISKWKHAHAFKLKVEGINLSNKLNKEYKEELKKLKYIKTDAEGYDLYIIKALTDIIKEYKPYIKSEIYKLTSPEYRIELYNILKKIGYTVYKAQDEVNLKGTKLSLDNLMDWKHYDIFCVPD